MVDQRVYSQNMDVAACVKELQEYFSAQGYETQIIGTAPDVLVQMRKRGTLRTITGTANAMTTQFSRNKGGIMVTLGAQKWVDKAAVGAVGAMVFAPLLVTAAYGAWKQSKLPEQCWHIIEKYGMACPKCGALYESSKFCLRCGIALV
jgi:hypothetical protein